MRNAGKVPVDAFIFIDGVHHTAYQPFAGSGPFLPPGINLIGEVYLHRGHLVPADGEYLVQQGYELGICLGISEFAQALRKPAQELITGYKER